MITILVIDDDLLVRRTVKRVLESVGYHVIEARNGAEGLGLFSEHHPGLVITDVFMPEKEGIETIRELRPLAPDTPIIAISGGYKVIDPLACATAFGANATLAKPFRVEALIELVERLLPRPAGEPLPETQESAAGPMAKSA